MKKPEKGIKLHSTCLKNINTFFQLLKVGLSIEFIINFKNSLSLEFIIQLNNINEVQLNTFYKKKIRYEYIQIHMYMYTYIA